MRRKSPNLSSVALLAMLTILIFASISCTDKLNILDTDDFPYKEENGTINFATYSCEKVAPYSTGIITGGSYYLPVGNYEGYSTRPVMRFLGLPSGITVNSALLHLKSSSVYGNPEDVTVKVYKVTETWEESDIDPVITFDPEPIAEYTSDLDSTVTDTVSIPAELVQVWVDANSDTTIPNYGIMLEMSSTFAMKEYYSSETDYPPYITVNYTYSGGEYEDDYQATKDMFEITAKKPLPDNGMVLDHLNGSRILVEMKNIGISTGSTINNAFLKIPIDYSNSLHSSTRQHILSVFSLSSVDWSSASVALDSVNYSQGVISSDTVTVDITDQVTDWVRGDTPQLGFMLKAANEGWDIGRYPLLRALSGNFLSITMEIMYTIPPKKRF